MWGGGTESHGHFELYNFYISTFLQRDQMFLHFQMPLVQMLSQQSFVYNLKWLESKYFEIFPNACLTLNI